MTDTKMRVCRNMDCHETLGAEGIAARIRARGEL